ncbi:MAG: DoxX family protein [Fimbriimonadaceae bacterium]|nr:DoxX family protein [Fimbriimonadaceae bacterium]
MTNTATTITATTRSRTAGETRGAAAVVLGRLLFAAIFVVSAPMHFSPETIDAAAWRGVPLASLAVPASGLLELAGGLSVLLGYRAKLGAWALVLFLVPVTLAMHPFWAAADKAAMTLQLTMFLKNLSLIGGALLITQFGAGPMSLDARLRA